MAVSDSIEDQFLERLLDIPEFQLAGFKAKQLPEGGIAVSRRGHIRGVWKRHGDAFCWRPVDVVIGSFEVEDVDEALRRMMKIVLASLQIRAAVGRRMPTAA